MSSQQPDRALAGRRASDEATLAELFDARLNAHQEHLKLILEKGLRDNRHSFREEITAVGSRLETVAASVTENGARSTREHIEVRAEISRVIEQVKNLQALEPRVDQLERGDAIEQAALARERALKRTIWKAAATIAGIIAAAAGALAALPGGHP